MAQVKAMTSQLVGQAQAAAEQAEDATGQLTGQAEEQYTHFKNYVGTAETQEAEALGLTKAEAQAYPLYFDICFFYPYGNPSNAQITTVSLNVFTEI